MKKARVLIVIFAIAYFAQEAVRGVHRSLGITIAAFGAISLGVAFVRRKKQITEPQPRPFTAVKVVSFWITILLSGVLLWWLVQAR